ncbi:ABC transporter substrate-binding protein [Paenibacillus arenilitoris]|uniref:Extracellular solute-binding protein n=1 Tax=Paenibacillus arenilitoris TaxID=2772299 RepID=A0A927CMW3_9BACL|nr:extracellular solute-binding protein [Paenibacillus arenilitoris]MBD2868525.1 extracellular solute-binding protein [Paenibacillus arenilitoris]
MKKLLITALAACFAITGLAGCTSNNGTNAPEQSDNAQSTNEASVEPANTEGSGDGGNSLFFYTAQNPVYEDEANFERLIGQYIRKKFPDIDLKHVHWNDGTRYEDLIAKGTIPDIVFEQVRRNTSRMVKKFKLEYDMSDLIKQFNFDTSKLDPASMEVIKTASDGKTYALPFEMSDFVLAYNKDIFDKYGLDYPKDGMTYDEAYELAKKLTRQDGDITYKGFQQHPSHYMMYNQLSEPALDPNEDKGALDSDTWLKIVNNIRRFYEIPGNQFTTTSDFPKGQMAMSVDVVENVLKWSTEYPDLNFDLASVPVFPEASSSKYQPNLNGLFITQQSKNKELAFQVIQYLLSDEVQAERQKESIIGPLNVPEVQQAFAQNVPQMKDKHIQALFALQSAMPAPRKPGLTFINPPVQQVFQPNIFEQSKDSATALRVVNEMINKQLAETKAAIDAGGDGTAYQ